MYKSRFLILLALFALWGGAASAKTHKKTSTPASTGGSKSKQASAPAKKRSASAAASQHSSSTRHASSRSGRGSSHSKSTGKRRGDSAASREASRRMRQQAPTPDRYREIQQALAARGYFQGEANGSWGSDSVDALKRFQQEQNLAPTGKLDSVSLIALGLGPKRNNIAQTNPQSPQTRPPDDNRRSQGSERP